MTSGRPNSDSDDRDKAQQRVDDRFDATADYWRSVYEVDNLDGAIYRKRREVALAWAADVRPDGDRELRALDAGCGAGLLAAGLAELGYRVDAMDSSAEMRGVATEHLTARGLADRVSIAAGDVHSLEWADATFDLSAALGVIPWLHTPASAVRELARVTRPGGHVLITADNRHRLTHLLDPQYNPGLARIRPAVGDWLRARGLRGPRPTIVTERRYTPSEMDDFFAAAGLVPVRRATVGFGQFTLLGRGVLPRSRERTVNDWMQRHADRGLWPLRGHGNHDVVLARKPPA